DWAKREVRAGRNAASCQDCHMSLYPGVCEPAPGTPANAGALCPTGTALSPRKPGSYPSELLGQTERSVVTHFFSGVDVPLSSEFESGRVGEAGVDLHGVPLGARRRRDLLLRHSLRFAVIGARRSGASLEIPIEVENIGAGHRVPAGFSQEREIWI